MKFKVKRDDLNTNVLYTLRGVVVDGRLKNNQRRWIQFNTRSHNGDPIMITRTGYTSHGAICFISREQAEAFLDSFVKSDKRQNNYNVLWNVSRVAPNFGKGTFKEVDTIYGRCLKRVSHQ